MNKKRISIILVAVIIIAIGITGYSYATRTTNVKYTEFAVHLEQGNVEQVTIGENRITYILEGDDTKYSTVNPGADDFKEKLLLNDVEVDDEIINGDNFALILDYIIDIIFFAIIIAIVMKVKSSFSGNFKMTKNTGVSFDDIAGMDRIKSDLRLVVDFMKNPEEYKKRGMRPIKGIIFEGPPGNGKTLLARALANECNVNFIATKGADFQSALMAMGPAKVNALFKKAQKHKPCIIFIDEFDGIGEARNYAGTGIDKENNRMIITMLNAMDGFESGSGVMVIAATNSFMSLDPALVRPGRFDLRYHMGNPDKKTIGKLVEIYTKDKKLAQDVVVSSLINQLEGRSCAAIEAIINQATLISLSQSKMEVDKACFDEAMRIVK